MKYKNYMTFKFRYKLPIKFYWNILCPCVYMSFIAAFALQRQS